MAYDGSLKFDTKIDSTGFAGGIAQLKSTALAAIGAIGAAFASGAIAKALVGQISLVEQYGSAINDQAQKISISAKAYQELSYLFEQTGGNADVLQMGIKTLSNAVVDGSKAFETLGISLEDARAMSQEDLFDLVLTQLAEMPPSAERTAAAVDLLGRSATELNPLLNLGADGIAKMKQQAQEYGLIMTDEAVAATDAYGDAVTLAQKSGEALRNAMVGKMLPTLTKVASSFADVAKKATEAFNARGISGVVDVITDKFPGATAAVSGLAAAFTALLVIKAVQKGMAALTVVQSALNAMIASGTAKTLAQAAAQSLLNAVMNANPVMLFVTALGLMVGGMVLINKNFDKINPQMAQYTDATKQASQQTKQLSGDMRDSAKAYEDASVEIEKQEQASRGLIDTLYDMSAAYQGSSIEQRKMQAIVDELNGTYAGLNLAYDSNTGKVNKNRAAVESLVAAKIKEAKATADIERSVALIKEESDAKYNLYVAQDNYNKLAATGASKTSAAMRFASKSVREAQAAYDEASAAVATHNDYLSETGTVAEETTQSLNALKEAERGVAEETQNAIIGGYEFSEEVLTQIGITADDAATRLDKFTSAATSMFDKIDTKSRVTVKTMIDTLTANTAAMQQWGDNIALLGDKLPAELLQPLIDQGPEKMAGVLNALAKASPEELDALVAQFDAGGEEAREAWLQSLGAGTSAEENPLATVLEGSTDAVKKAGEEAGAALVQSISEQDYTEATGTMTDAFTEAFRQIKDAFAKMLQEIHYDLAYAIGGVSIDIAQMARDVNRALSSIKTSITIRVNTIYTSDGSPGSSGGGGTSKVTLPSASQISAGASSTVTAAKISASVGASVGKTVNISAPITVQGVTESPAKLAAKLTKNLEGVLYGNT